MVFAPNAHPHAYWSFNRSSRSCDWSDRLHSEYDSQGTIVHAIEDVRPVIDEVAVGARGLVVVAFQACEAVYRALDPVLYVVGIGGVPYDKDDLATICVSALGFETPVLIRGAFVVMMGEVTIIEVSQFFPIDCWLDDPATTVIVTGA